MKKLISRFEKDLQISESYATFRVWGVLTMILVIISIIVASLLIFPYGQSRTDSMILPEGNYEVTDSMPDSNKYYVIETNYNDLVKLHSESIFVTSNNSHVALIKIIDERTVTYCNLKMIFNIKNLSYEISSVEKIKDGVAYIKYERLTEKMIILNIVIPLLLIIFFVLLIFGMQSSKDYIEVPTIGPFSESKTVRLKVWF